MLIFFSIFESFLSSFSQHVNVFWQFFYTKNWLPIEKNYKIKNEKSDFFGANLRYVKIFEFRWWLWYQVWGKFEKFEQHSSKLFSFLLCVRMIKFSHGCTIEKMFLKKSKISEILPTCNPLLENKNFVDLTYGRNGCFFESKSRNFMKIIHSWGCRIFPTPPLRYGCWIVEIGCFFSKI